MVYQVRAENRPIPNGSASVLVLEETEIGARAEISPALGFNCFRWTAIGDKQRLDLLYADEHFLETTRPTRGGIPILFPFPNRIRDGQFSWEGKKYQLPLNDSDQKNAIHGFACRLPWRVVTQGANEENAWITGEFQGSVDAPASLSQWPTDYRIRLTYRLTQTTLTLEAMIDNPDQGPLPLGLGFHPYLRVPLVPGRNLEESWVQAKAHEYWELVDSLPTGVRRTVDPARNLTCPRRYHELNLDDVLTGLEPAPAPGADGLCYRGTVGQGGGVRVQLDTSPAFRELVAFTPSHRQAICLEPFTCTTDAINLQARGIDAGLLVLKPGEKWAGRMKFELVCR